MTYFFVEATDIRNIFNVKFTSINNETSRKIYNVN